MTSAMLRRGPSRQLRFCASADDAPSAPGAYVLQVDLAEPLSVKLGGSSRAELPAGRYLYCGSARGPGGLKARLARHARRGKSPRWHVDQLTERGVITGIWVARDGRECDLVEMLAPLPTPIRGFGSSDCSRCERLASARADARGASLVAGDRPGRPASPDLNGHDPRATLTHRLHD